MKASPAMVGGFVLGGLTLAALAILFFGGMRLFTPTLQAVVFFPSSVAGLAVGAPVTFRGVQVGSVRKIALRLNVADRSSIIPTYIELDADRISWQDDAATGPKSTAEPGIPRLVQAGLRATLSTPSLVTGQLALHRELRASLSEIFPTDRGASFSGRRNAASRFSVGTEGSRLIADIGG